MTRRFKAQKGFTLVEMIVVIAIIAILAAVIIPTTAGFIDRARLARDRMMAADMTNILTTHAFEHAIDQNDPHAIREIITRFSENGHDFVAHASNTGFFYVPTLNAVRALKFNDAITRHFDLSDSVQANGLSFLTHVQSVDAFDATLITMPEQLFGSDKMLLSTRGTKVADIVYGLRNGYAHPVLVAHNESSPFQRTHAEQDRLSWLLDTFHPEKTVYVSHAEWRTDAQDGGMIEHVIFAPGLSHVPANNGGDWQFLETIETIQLPSSVQTIDQSAFTHAAFAGKTIVSNVPLFVHALALDSSVNIQVPSMNVLCDEAWEDRLLDVSEVITIHRALVEDTVIQQAIIESLPQETRQTVTAYHWMTRGRTAVLRVFTHQGLYAEVTTTLED